MLRSIGDAVIVRDASGRITFFNAAAEDLIGISSSAACGGSEQHPFQIRYDDGDLPPVDLPVDSNWENGLRFRTGTLVRPDGSERLVVTSAAPIHKGEAAKDPHGTVLILRDISNIKKIEQALRENNWFLKRSNDSLTELSHSLSHDLQEPLRAITCYSQMLSNKADNSISEHGQQYLQFIQDGCNRMNSLLSSLLEYYHASASQKAPAAAVDSAACFEEALLNLAAAIAISGAVVTASDLPFLHIHPTALLQIFQNLLGNAIKYRGKDTPQVRVSAAQDGAFWTFTVADNGTGFNASEADAIFGLFKRAHGREQSGSGVGLATCRRLVEQYGGKIWADSVVNQGSQFHFTVPVVPPLTVQ